MDENPCNCNTCTHFETVYGKRRACSHRCNSPLLDKYDSSVRDIGWDEYFGTFDFGCMGHPRAREYLMKDILEELERRKTDLNLALDRPILGTHMEYQNLAVMEEKVEMLDEITDLIKNGVEKK